MSYQNLSSIQIAVLELLSSGESLTRWQIRTKTGIRVKSLRDSIRRLGDRQLVEIKYVDGNFKYLLTRDGSKALDFYKKRERPREKPPNRND